MKSFVMIIDYQYCTGCHACEVSCRNEKEYPLEVCGINVTQHGPIKYKNECQWDYVPVVNQFCDLCSDRMAEGKVPSCQLHCLSSCIEVVKVSEVAEKLAKYGDRTVVFVP